MTLKCLPLLAVLLLAACSPRADESSPEPKQETAAVPTPTAEAASATATPAPVSLPGEYRVAGVGGEELDSQTGHAVSITENTIDYMRCAGFAWTYTYEDGVLETTRIPTSPDEIICRPTPGAWRIGVALSEATRVKRTSANGIEFSGGGHSVLLFSQ